MKTLTLADRTISTELKSFVMGIVNVNHCSFFSESQGGAKKALQLISEGTDIIDLGAESTKPGSTYITAAEEIKKLIPVIQKIRKSSDIPISVDTRKTEVFKACFEEGADILNDISAFEDSPELADYCSEKKVPVILMHKRGIPSEMQKNTDYRDIFSEVQYYLTERADFAIAHGINKEKIILDPGFGFGKNTEGNLELLRSCKDLCQNQYKLLIGLSRKTFIGEITGRKTEERLSGTLAANMFAAQNDAFILRVHDVKETVDMLKILQALEK